MIQTISPSLNFLIQKYNLDISVVKVDDLSLGNRVDSEFYQNIFLDVYQKVLSKGSKLDAKIIHPTELKRIYSEEGLQILLAQNVRNNQLSFNSVAFMPFNVRGKIKWNLLKENDVLMTRSWANFGQTAHYLWEPVEIYACADVLIIRDSQVNWLFLSTFFNTYHGNLLRDRWCYGLAQPHIAPSYLKTIPIPLPSVSFQNSIASLIQEAHEKRELSKTLYTKAEQILLSELGLIDWSPSEENIAEKMSEEVELFGRCDAEFFQPKYDQIISKIESYKWGFSQIHKEFDINNKKIDSSKDIYNYVEIWDIDVSNGEVSSNKVAREDLPANAKIQIHRGDLLVSTVRPYRWAVWIVDFECSDLVGSWAFTVLVQKTDKYFKEVLMVLLRTFVYKELMLRYNVWTSYPVIKDQDVLNLPIPIFSSGTQLMIRSEIMASHEARKLSKDLLEKAKRAVEILIEEDEEAAEEYLNS